MELYGPGQPPRYIQPFPALLSEGPAGSGAGGGAASERGSIGGAMLGLEAERRR